ncbi:hypothetical protein G3H63_00330 [Microbacterium resistens]|nr:hypothetical protein [Microbacterium resistens]
MSVLCGFDDDLTQQIAATSYRVRGLLTKIHPALEQVIRLRLDHPTVMDLPQRYPSPASLTTAREMRIGDRLSELALRIRRTIAGELTQALTERTMVVVASRRGNKILKWVLILSAFDALQDPISRSYCDRKIPQGRQHKQSLIPLARRCCDVLHAMLRDDTLYIKPQSRSRLKRKTIGPPLRASRRLIWLGYPSFLSPLGEPCPSIVCDAASPPSPS